MSPPSSSSTRSSSPVPSPRCRQRIFWHLWWWWGRVLGRFCIIYTHALTYTDEFDLSGEEEEEEEEVEVEVEMAVDYDEVSQETMLIGIRNYQRRLLQMGLRSLRDVAFLGAVVDQAFIKRTRLRRGLRRLQVCVTRENREIQRRSRQSDCTEEMEAIIEVSKRMQYYALLPHLFANYCTFYYDYDYNQIVHGCGF